MRLNMKLEHKNILVDNVNIHYVESGQSAYVTNAINAKDISTATVITAAKPTMIFLHGFAEYWQTWSAQLIFSLRQHNWKNAALNGVLVKP
jgi:pimeloyl-ACP methyl ester carboxylesterase